MLNKTVLFRDTCHLNESFFLILWYSYCNFDRALLQYEIFLVKFAINYPKLSKKTHRDDRYIEMIQSCLTSLIITIDGYDLKTIDLGWLR